MSYNNPVPAALAVVRVRRTDGSLALLGIVRKLTPAGGTAFPGGYIDEMETARMAAARELWEETRLVTDASQWRLLDDRISVQNRLLVFCEFMFEIPEDLLAEFLPTKEASAVLCLTLDSEICFPNHAAVARAYLAQTTPHAYPEMRPVMDMSPAL
jgi:8-oxo-dGTP pyrophosphatase MutT (NUDIX family)